MLHWNAAPCFLLVKKSSPSEDHGGCRQPFHTFLEPETQAMHTLHFIHLFPSSRPWNAHGPQYWGLISKIIASKLLVLDNPAGLRLVKKAWRGRLSTAVKSIFLLGALRRCGKRTEIFKHSLERQHHRIHFLLTTW
jgi:hypothetical protein